MYYRSSELTLQKVERLPQGPNDAIMWDVTWKHKGIGNHTQSTRVMLHLVYVPVWMAFSKRGKHALAFEYNNSMDIDEPITLVGYWVDRYRRAPSLNDDIAAIALQLK